MARRMLIDATHSEETRVVVLNGTKLEEFDFETSTKKQIKGNIYLAKITRVEPSLQAAFVEYGGNRHGFLAFSEIHPDYYRIPVSDREAMMDAERRARSEGSDEDYESHEHHEVPDEPNGHHHDDNGYSHDHEEHVVDEHHDEPHETAAPEEHPAALEPPAETIEHAAESDGQAPDSDPQSLAATDGSTVATAYAPAEPFETEQPDAATGSESAAGETEAAAESGDVETVEHPAEAEHAEDHHDEESATPIETFGGDELEEVQARPRVRHHRNYKIQEVIKRRQILLIQVTKEERGTKGAAITTYLSLAGRYCVLMPNAGRGGGVSRKITSAVDRRRLKELMDELEVPEGMGLIVRTAGSERSKVEIKRDYDYLLRLWDDIRELTLRSSAPALIYEEGTLIKRAIRDLYTRDIDEILVEGEEGYRTAKEFMRMLMPSHASRVKAYRDPAIPLFHRFQIDSQIDQIHNPVVQLKSGGYIVINPTEALVSIDVNSGRATRERNIEETATKTNLEAADEIGRQLRLRDLAGLVVIDFIDMEDNRNQRAVEARVKDAMKVDRARIQLGRISPFGLLELSRQRLRSSLIEASTQTCPHCNGTGTIRSTESTTLVVLRALEEEGIRQRTAEVTVFVPTHIALYLLNQKRDALIGIEKRYGFRVTVAQDDELIPPAYRLDRVRALTPAELAALPAPTMAPIVEEPEEDEYIEEGAETERETGEGADGEDRPRRKRRRRKRRRGGEFDGETSSQEDGEIGDEADGGEEPAESHEEPATGETGVEVPAESGEPAPVPVAASDEETGDHRRRRRGRRGGRRRREEGQPSAPAEEFDAMGTPSPFDFARDGRVDAFVDQIEVVEDIPLHPEAAPQPDPEPVDAVPAEAIVMGVAEEAAPAEATEAAAPKRRRAPRKKAPAAAAEETPAAAVETVAEEPAPAPKRRRTRKPAAEKVEVVETEAAAPEPTLPTVIVEAESMAVADIPIADATEAMPVEVTPEPEPAPDPDRPRRSGWWKRILPSA